MTVMPPNNAISDAFIAEMRKFGVDPSLHRPRQRAASESTSSRTARISGRRKCSTTARAARSRWPSRVDIDFAKAFEGAGWFHITGITPAISEGAAQLAVESVRDREGDRA